MPVKIDGQTYYRTAEVCDKARISRAALFRWLKTGCYQKPYWDRRGWRLFTENDMTFIVAESNRIEVEDTDGR